jgi:hypothetical protein
MLEVVLSLLDSKAAQAIAQRRGVSEETLVSNLISEEAAIELTGWRVSREPVQHPDSAPDLSAHDKTQTAG